MPRRLVRRRTVSAIRTAFRGAALRARSSGTAHLLYLDPGENCFKVERESTASPDAAGHAAAAPAAAPGSVQERLARQALPSPLKWYCDGRELQTESVLACIFLPGGEASGQALEFAIGERRFRLKADALTGRPLITESQP
jgi:hypothetical protein